jgi:hypothetical protein
VALPKMRADMVVGSPEWAKSTLEYAKSLWHSRENSEARWQAVVEELRQGRAWKTLGKRTLNQLLRETIGVTVKQSHDVLKLKKRGRPPVLGRVGKPDNVRIDYGNSRDYILARLQRDGHSDLIAQVYAGELSAHAAAERVGYRKAKTPLQQLEHWWGKATPDERLAFLRWARTS